MQMKLTFVRPGSERKFDPVLNHFAEACSLTQEAARSSTPVRPRGTISGRSRKPEMMASLDESDMRIVKDA
jgi:hypothetical protein